MFNSRLTLLLISAVACLLALPTGAVQDPNIDEDTNCPRNVNHKCVTCAEDGNRYGCYCELTDGTEIVTANLFTSCPIEDEDPCTTHNCQNGAACVRKNLKEYACNCTAGFGGTFCNETLPKCTDANIKCPNAKCVDTGSASLPVYCQCYDGTRRIPLYNETCPPSPCYEAGTEIPVCENNGTCLIINNGAVCQCVGGWAGQNCTKKLKTPLCESKPSICGVGKCQQSLTPPYYSCNCGNFPSTFAKQLDDLIACERSDCYYQNPCQNGGTCSNKAGGSFLCQCPPQYTGYRCEKQSACFVNPCRNQATCEAFNETSYFCNCPAYFTGQQCEISVPNPCVSKNCGPYGVCHDLGGTGTCYCSDGYHYDGSPCPDPCTNINCNGGVCTRRANATYEAYCSCPVGRVGDNCEQPDDICRTTPPCGGGYCVPNYRSVRGYSCVCVGGTVKNEPCPFSSACPIKTCGTKGICVQTDGLKITPTTLPIPYVCSCLNGYISSSNCNDVLDNQVPDAVTKCGATKGKPYPSRNPDSPIGCWCNNGTHVPEINDDMSVPICV